MTGWRGRRGAVITSVTGTVFIAAGAFWLSFVSLADLAGRAGIGAGQSWAWPLIVDGVIVVSTVAVVALAGDRAAWYPWTLLVGGAAVSVTANALHAIVAADADVPPTLAASVAAVPPIVLLASTHLSVVLVRTTTRLDAGAVSEASSTAIVTTEPVGLSEPRALPSVPPEPAVELADRRVRAAALREAGWSNKKIAREVGVHASTVGRWFSDAHHPDEPGQLSPEPVMEGTTHEYR